MNRHPSAAQDATPGSSPSFQSETNPQMPKNTRRIVVRAVIWRIWSRFRLERYLARMAIP